MPQISVIVPVYKVEPYLHRCVDSILGQTFTDFELILVDDGSPDGCPAICDEYARQDDRVLVIHQENGGLSAARNAGIDWAFANSDSQWLTFIDSDDWVHPEYLWSLHAAASEHNVPVSKCAYVTVYAEADILPEMDRSFRLMDMEDAYLLKNSGVCACAKLYRKEAFSKIRFPIGKLHEDLFTIHKVLFQYDSIAVSSAAMYYYWNNPESITKGRWNPHRLDQFDAFNEQLSFFRERQALQIHQQLIGLYMEAIAEQYSMLSASDYPHKGRYLRLFRRRMRRIIIQSYIYSCNSWNTHKWCYNIAFPILMNAYWHIKALRNKLRLHD